MEASKKIAVVHYDKALAEILADMTQALGYTPHTKLVNRTTTPQEVASFIRGVGPNLVLLTENYQGNRFDPDPETRGFQIGEGIGALIEIRKEHPRSELPVYMVSEGPYVERALQSGANGYLPLATEMVSAFEKPKNYVEELRKFLELNIQS